MSVALKSGPFSGFTRLAPNIWYLDTTDGLVADGTASASSQPNLIILSTWMGAAPKHIFKYVVGYKELFPKSPILMITNSIGNIVLQSYESHKQKLKPAIRQIHNVASTQQNPKILLHLFSNGGALQTTQLAFLYHQQFNVPLPITSMILDSAPGTATYWRSVKAVAVGLPRFILIRLLGLLAIHILCIGMWISDHIVRRENFIKKVRRRLIDPDLFPMSAPRCYVYSKADDMVGWQDVELHAELAEKKGYQVEKRRFENSKHVGHMVLDPEKYWNTVQRMAS